MAGDMVVPYLCGGFASWRAGSGLEEDPVVVNTTSAEGLGACFFSILVIESDFDLFQILEEQKTCLLQLPQLCGNILSIMLELLLIAFFM